MRKVLVAGLAAILIAPTAARAQATPPAEESPPPPETVRGPPTDEAVQPGEEPRQKAAPAPPRDDIRESPPPPERVQVPGELRRDEPALPSARGGPLHPGDEILPPDAKKPTPPEKPKLDEAAGGVAGGIAANIAGTAVAGPIGGIAASMVGSSLGSATVRVGKRVLGIGKKKQAEPAVQQASAAPEAGADASATAVPPYRGEPSEAPPP
jgi:hypothetical protein